jgi:hypothetical protein
LQALFVYRKLNLSQLSDLLEVSKSTVLHHLKKFEDLDLVAHDEIKAKFGALPTKIYRFNVEIFDTITREFDYVVNFQNFENIGEFFFTLKAKQLFFSMIAQIFEKTVNFFERYGEKIKDSMQNSPEDLMALIKKMDVWFNIDYLTQPRKDFVMKRSKEGIIPIRVPEQTETPEETGEIHPYLFFHVLLPIPAILNFTAEIDPEENQ